MSVNQLVETVEAGVATESLVTALVSGLATSVLKGTTDPQQMVTAAFTTGAATALGCNVAKAMISANPEFIDEGNEYMQIGKKVVVSGLVTLAVARLGGVSYGSLQEMAIAGAIGGASCYVGAMLAGDIQSRFASQ